MANRTPKQAAALRKAQLASAAKRRGHGKGRKVAKGVLVGAAVAGAVYSGHKTRHHVRDKALQKRHGGEYIPRKGTYSHHTNVNAARKIVKQGQFKPTGQHAGHGSRDGVWLTHHRKRGHFDGHARNIFGKARVSVKLKRKEVLKHRTYSIPGGTKHGGDKNIYHVQIHKSHVNKKKLKHNLPKTSRTIRRRYKAHVKFNGNKTYFNSSVSPARRTVKRAYKRGKRY